jgi:hypothetical protein
MVIAPINAQSAYFQRHCNVGRVAARIVSKPTDMTDPNPSGLARGSSIPSSTCGLDAWRAPLKPDAGSARGA